MLHVVDRDVHSEISRTRNSDPFVFAVLNVDVVFAEPELLANFFLDRRAAEHFACSWVLVSQLLGHVKLDNFSVVVLGLDFFRVEYVALSKPGLLLYSVFPDALPVLLA